VQLMQRDVLPPPDKGISELVIPVTDLDVKIEGDSHIRKPSGDIYWIGSGRKADMRNGIADPIRFIVVELKPAQN